MEPQYNVSIPGINEQAPMPGQNPPQPNYEAPGMNHWALQEACKKELAKGVFPEFYIKAVQDKAATREQGRPMYFDQEWVRITLRGDKNTVMDRPVSDKDRTEQFPALYQAFKQGQHRSSFGTPLEEWPLMSRSQVESLKHNNVYTVEDLAAIDDAGIQQIGMGAREWQKQAQAYLDQAADSATPAKLVKQIEQLQQQVDALAASNEQLGHAAEETVNSKEALTKAQQDMNEMATAMNELQMANASLENRIAGLQMKYDAEKQAHSIAKSKLTRATNELSKLKEDK